jgi:hypothetical protein
MKTHRLFTKTYRLMAKPHRIILETHRIKEATAFSLSLISLKISILHYMMTNHYKLKSWIVFPMLSCYNMECRNVKFNHIKPILYEEKFFFSVNPQS